MQEKKIVKISVPINKYIVWLALTKLLTTHNLPIQAVEWEGIKLIFDPICTALGITLNRKTTKEHINKIIATLKAKLAKEMEGKLVSVQIDSASRHGRHILGIGVNFYDGKKIVIRALGE